MSINLVFLVPPSHHLSSVGFFKTSPYGARNKKEGGPRICFISLCSQINWFAIMMQVVCILGKCLCKCSPREKKNLPKKAAAVWGACVV